MFYELCDAICMKSKFSQIELGTYLYERLLSVPNIRIYGPAPSKEVKRASLCSFNVENLHPTDLATFLDQQVRRGNTISSYMHFLVLNTFMLHLSKQFFLKKV